MIENFLQQSALMQMMRSFSRKKEAPPQDQPGDFSALFSKAEPSITPADLGAEQPQLSTPETVQTPEQDFQSLHIYLPGIMGDEKGMAAIYEQVEATIAQAYPDSKFIGKSSIVSADFLKRPDGDRYVLLSRQIVEALKAGKDIYLYGHSLGAREVSHLLHRVKKLHPELWREGKGIDKLHIVLMSPAGFAKNITETARSFKNLLKYITLAGAEVSEHIYGLETMAYLPLRKDGAQAGGMEATDPQAQADLLTKHFAEFSQLDEAGGVEDADQVTQVFQEPSQEQLDARYNALTDDEKAELQRIDDSIHFYAKRGNTEYVRIYVQKRGKLLSKYSQAAYGGNLPEKPAPTAGGEQDATDKEAEATEKTPWVYVQAVLGMGRALGGLLFGTTHKEMKAWKEKGADIKFLVPEFDVLVSLSEVEDFLGDEEDLATNVVVLRSTTHSDSSVERSVLAEGIRVVNAREFMMTAVQVSEPQSVDVQ